MSAPIEILTETEAERGWRFTAQAVQPDGSLLKIVLELSWADYDFWCPDGTAPPAAVAECALRVILHHRGDRPLPARLDASHARRFHPEADLEIRRSLSPLDRP
ncbi:MAG: hypothetical protein ACKPEA_05550 [Planctomycetota bacterium]